MRSSVVYLTFVLLGTISLAVSAASTNSPFERGALSNAQKNAWDTYVSREAGTFGCEYEDDPRLSESPDELFNQILDNESIEPVMVTYRTLMNMGPNSRNLLSSNIKIASLECNAVYYTGEELVGMPVIPFEEALTILHDDLANYNDPNRIISLSNTFVVATIDPRWFWTFFVADKGHMDLLGYDFKTLVRIEKILSKRDKELTYEQDDYNILSHLYEAMSNYGIEFYSDTGSCEKSPEEPSSDLFVWPEINDGIVRSFYEYHNIEYKGKWKTKSKVDENGITLYREKAVDNPSIPLFNVERGLAIYSKECKS